MHDLLCRRLTVNQDSEDTLLISNLSVTRADFFQVVDAWTSVLPLHSGDRVLVLAEKHWALVALFVACLINRWIFVPVSPGTKRLRALEIQRDLDPALTFADDGLSLEAVFTATSTSDLINRIKGLQVEVSENLKPQPVPENVALLLHTSGTTGHPKAAMITIQMIYTNLIDLESLWGIKDSDIVLHCLPIHHIHGLLLASLLPIMAQAKINWQSSVSVVCQEWFHCTVFMSVPEVYKRLLRENSISKNGKMRLLISGSGPIEADVVDEFNKRFGYKILVRYGMSECGMITSGSPQDTLEEIRGSVGRPLKDREIRISTHQSEVQVKSSTIFIGYWNDPVKTAASFTYDGWFKTGDVGFVKNGLLYLNGRVDDMFIIGGENVYPAYIETHVLRPLALQEQWLDYCCSCVSNSLIGNTNEVYTLETRLCCLYVPSRVVKSLWKIGQDKAPVFHEQPNWTAPLTQIWESKLVPKIFIPCHSIIRNEMGKLCRQQIMKHLNT
eukprot:Blabericola_migrator_1__10214@NODE_570_length_7533_cov_212_053308_g425_i0_p1_GENE_NODE_570_length_7533_cov_212_053308_g425_i0NODE_570_length_7533_cov_212_053308_g425_i0_p1_ORF_typecomplete_len499_score72_88AMPbinding/PF00501_28/1e73DHFR_1/PF00186_19/0_032_NODE_570_length_7533_cov_212_053308_g425_i055317027